MNVLNEDTLSGIVSYLSIDDAWCLAATARVFYPIARQKALSTVEFTNRHSLERGCEFLLADVPNRLHWVRDLKITIHSPRLALLLANLLEQADLLTRLSLGSMDLWIRSEPRVGSAVEGLKGIRQLELDEVGMLALQMVSKAQCKPLRLSLRSGAAKFGFIPSVTYPIDFAAAMSSIIFHESVEVLNIELHRKAPVPDSTEPKSHLSHQWLAVRHLTLTSWSDNFPLLDDLVRAFPHLRSLRLDGPNVIASRLDARGGACWPKLDFVYGSILTLAHWKICCPVHHLDISIFLPFMSKDEYAHRMAQSASLTLPIIRDASPVVLSVDRAAAYRNFGSDAELWTSLVDAAPRLRVLHLDLQEFQPQASGEWMDRIPPVLALSGLLCIQLHVRDETTTLELQMSTLLAQAIPTLRYIALSKEPFTRPDDALAPGPFGDDFSWRWWRVVEIQRERTVRQIPSDMGERIATYLYSPDHDYASNLDDSLFNRPAAFDRK